MPLSFIHLTFIPMAMILTLPMAQCATGFLVIRNGERVVLIHGISTGAASYDKIARYLVSGFACVSGMTHRGIQ